MNNITPDYAERALVSFGNFLLKKYKVEKFGHSDDYCEVSHADLENWKEANPNHVPDEVMTTRANDTVFNSYKEENNLLKDDLLFDGTEEDKQFYVNEANEQYKIVLKLIGKNAELEATATKWINASMTDSFPPEKTDVYGKWVDDTGEVVCGIVDQVDIINLVETMAGDKPRYEVFWLYEIDYNVKTQEAGDDFEYNRQAVKNMSQNRDVLMGENKLLKDYISVVRVEVIYEMEQHVLSNEDDWSRNPQGALKHFKREQLKAKFIPNYTLEEIHQRQDVLAQLGKSADSLKKSYPAPSIEEVWNAFDEWSEPEYIGSAYDVWEAAINWYKEQIKHKLTMKEKHIVPPGVVAFRQHNQIYYQMDMDYEKWYNIHVNREGYGKGTIHTISEADKEWSVGDKTSLGAINSFEWSAYHNQWNVLTDQGTWAVWTIGKFSYDYLKRVCANVAELLNKQT